MFGQEPGKVFVEQASEYDAWYDSPRGKALFASEVACLRPLVEIFPRPRLEVGVGTGRFASALEVDHGIDPSAETLELARRRGVSVSAGSGEAIPFDDSSYGCVLMAFTLCFVKDAAEVLAEVGRVLKPGGGLVLGLLLSGTPWADSYARKGAEGHPVYRNAHFYSHEEVSLLLANAGFRVVAERSTLFQPPGLKKHGVEPCVEGFSISAGFVAIAARKGPGTDSEES
jgi:ubiquinone/menaquinone biosynthesis C-methylase UbiE